MRWASVVFPYGLAIFEGYINYQFWRHFLELRVHDRRFPIAVMACSVTLLYAVNQMHNSPLNMLASIALCCGVCQILFSDSAWKKLFYAFLGWFVMVGAEFLVSMGLGLNSGMETIDILVDERRNFMFTIVTKLVTLLLYQLICRHSKHGKKGFYTSLVSYFYLFSIASLILYIGIFYSCSSVSDENGVFTLILAGCIILLFANLALFIVYDRMVQMTESVKEYELMDMKRHMTNQHYIQMEAMNQRHSKIIHDLRGHLSVIGNLAQRSQNMEIIQLLSELNQHIEDASENIYCRHPVLNAILNEKRKNAQKYRVDYQVMIEPGFWLPGIQEIDMISIFNNLIDNAVEAAGKADNGFVKVQLYLVNDGKFSMIKIENSATEAPVQRVDGTFISKKQDPEMHGIGFRYTKELVEKYDGFFQNCYEDSVFTVTIMFSSSKEILQIFTQN